MPGSIHRIPLAWRNPQGGMTTSAGQSLPELSPAGGCRSHRALVHSNQMGNQMSIKRRWSASAIGGIVAAAMMLSGCAGIPADVDEWHSPHCPGRRPTRRNHPQPTVDRHHRPRQTLRGGRASRREIRRVDRRNRCGQWEVKLSSPTSSTPVPLILSSAGSPMTHHGPTTHRRRIPARHHGRHP